MSTHTAPATQAKVEYVSAGTNGALIQATITRYGQREHKYWTSQASASRLLRATHDCYICRWPLGGGRVGWYANLYVSDEQIRAYREGFAQ